MKQSSFSSLAYSRKKKKTKRELFLDEMDKVMPWSRLLRLITPCYPKSRYGRPPMPCDRMLRIYFLQQWFNLSDPAMEDSLYDIESMRRFAGIDLESDAVPDETTICKFRHLLERNDLMSKLFTEADRYLAEQGLVCRQGTIVDATIIHAPSSTKNKDHQRDPAMSSTKKGNQWHFGMKAHIGTCSKRGLVHSVVVTTASVHDSEVVDDLLHGQEREIYGDKAYVNEEKRRAFIKKGGRWRIQRKARRGKALTEQEKQWNRSRSKIRSLVEHPFGVIKHLWGYRKVRYRGIPKNASQVFTLMMLSNLYRVRAELC